MPVGIGGLKLVPVKYTLCPIGAFGQMSVPIGAAQWYRKSGKSKELLRTMVKAVFKLVIQLRSSDLKTD